MPNYLTPNEVKAEELAMLVEFGDLCKREGLRYSLAGGTLLCLSFLRVCFAEHENPLEPTSSLVYASKLFLVGGKPLDGSNVHPEKAFPVLVMGIHSDIAINVFQKNRMSPVA